MMGDSIGKCLLYFGIGLWRQRWQWQENGRMARTDTLVSVNTFV
jgi:hypothetical protein